MNAVIIFFLNYCSLQKRRDGSNDPTFNIITAWEASYTGKGILVAVVDDGVDGSHPELTKNYVMPSFCFSLFFFNNYYFLWILFGRKSYLNMLW